MNVPHENQSIPPTGTDYNQLLVSVSQTGTRPAGDTASLTYLVRVGSGVELYVSLEGIFGTLSCNDPYHAGNCISPQGPTNPYFVNGYQPMSHQILSVERLEDDVTPDAVAATGAIGRSVTFTPMSSYAGSSPTTWTCDLVPDGPDLMTYHPVPFYAIDADNIYRGDATRQPSEYTKAPKWKRNTGSCTVL